MAANPAPLPIVLNENNRYSLGALTLAFIGVIYFFSNHLHWIPPHLLELGWVDQHVPFIPETIWLYHSDLLMFVVAFILCKDLVLANQYLYSMVAAYIVGVVIFVAWPTAYPRNLYPLDPAQTDAITYALFSAFRQIESPANAFPSMHVASTFLTALMFWGRSRWKLLGFLFWAAAITVSTLTTKQHYLVDLWAGLSLALVTYWVFFQKLAYQRDGQPAIIQSEV